jgi:hypothetical protein
MTGKKGKQRLIRNASVNNKFALDIYIGTPYGSKKGHSWISVTAYLSSPHAALSAS